MKVINNKDIDNEYKYENLEDHNSNESVINKTKEEEAFIKMLMSMNFPLKVVNSVIGNISSCKKQMI